MLIVIVSKPVGCLNDEPVKDDKSGEIEKCGQCITKDSLRLAKNFGLVWENFLPIPTYAQNYLQANRVGKVPLNYLSWPLFGQNLRGNLSDSKQIEWS